ncbi:hypothetical protein GYA19_05340 [Candidatus Beckwithbacteria bacterium]|nr:hypothetical protein [Candidatus Beckwithbacteria bacterium]
MAKDIFEGVFRPEDQSPRLTRREFGGLVAATFFAAMGAELPKVAFAEGGVEQERSFGHVVTTGVPEHAKPNKVADLNTPVEKGGQTRTLTYLEDVVAEPGTLMTEDPNIARENRSAVLTLRSEIQQDIDRFSPAVVMMREADEMGPGQVLVTGDSFRVENLPGGVTVDLPTQGPDHSYIFLAIGPENWDGTTPQDGNFGVVVKVPESNQGTVKGTTLATGQYWSSNQATETITTALEKGQCGADGCKRVSFVGLRFGPKGPALSVVDFVRGADNNKLISKKIASNWDNR